MNTQSEKHSACSRRPGTGPRRQGRDLRAEAELIAGLGARTETAISTLYQRHGTAIHAIGRTLTGDRRLADEVVQQTFRSAWQTADRFEPGSDIATWLYGIARGRALALRDRPEQPPDADEPTSPDAQEIGEVRAAIDALPAEEREIVRLAHVEGLTYAEIGRRLGISVPAVRTRSFQAHRRLAEALGHVVETASNAEGCDRRSG